MGNAKRGTLIDAPPTSLLEQGDHLSRAEFERRYGLMPELKKAELIEGEVFVASPVRFQSHGRPSRLASAWLATYESLTPGVASADNTTVRLDMENEFQPDSFLLIQPAHGGSVQISADDYVEGAPELVIEIAASSVSIDLHRKKRVYQRNGVREYHVWLVEDAQIIAFTLDDGEYRLIPLADGLLKSRVFPGLWLDVDAALKQDLARVLDVVRTQGCMSPEHAAFVASLRR
jgi:Uma2 family endonuclease